MEEWYNMSENEKNRRIQHSREVLEAAKPHYVADDIRQLPDIIRDINDRLARGEQP